MAIVAKLSPVGVDLAISKIQTALYEGLVDNGTWTDYESYHRAYKNNSANGIKAEVHTCRDDYKDVFTDDQHGVSSFFIVSDDKTPLEANLFQTDIDIIFQIDLKKIYPNSPHRNDEEMHNEIASILTSMGGNFDLTNIITGIDNVYSEFDTGQLNYDDLQPFHVVRFTVRTKYKYVCAPVFAELFCNIGVVMSTTSTSDIGASDGTATATPTGAQSGISYLWSDGQTTQTAAGLSAGNISVIVTDNILPPPACTASGNIDVLEAIASFKTVYNGSATWTIVYTGTGVVVFSDGVTTQIGQSVTFSGGEWDTDNEKEVFITVEEPDKIIGFGNDWFSKGVTELYISLLTGLIDNLRFYSNPLTVLELPDATGNITELDVHLTLLTHLGMSGLVGISGKINGRGSPIQTVDFPPTSGVIDNLLFYDCDLRTFDFSTLTVEGTIHYYNNTLLDSVTDPVATSGVITEYHAYNTNVVNRDMSGYSNLGGEVKIFFTPMITILLPNSSQGFSLLDLSNNALNSVPLSSLTGLWTNNNTNVFLGNNNANVAGVNESLVEGDTVSSGSNGTGCLLNIAGSNDAPNDGTGAGGGFDGIQAAADMVTDGNSVVTS